MHIYQGGCASLMFAAHSLALLGIKLIDYVYRVGGRPYARFSKRKPI